MKKFLLTLIPVVLLIVTVVLFTLDRFGEKAKSLLSLPKVEQEVANTVQTANIVANGDILYHDVLYWSAQKEDGSYDFKPYYEYVKDRISNADLALGDYEGTISDKHPLSGYPLFNAPKEAAQDLKDIGYDVMDLAHNHILDSGIYGLNYTYRQFKDIGIEPVGVFVDRKREDIVVKEVNGIKIAILAYSYGFNGLEANISKEDYNKYLADLDEEKIKQDLERAEQLADITIVMPQMGVEYELQPTKEQVELYDKMISWGADVIFGGHPHVVEPAKIVEHNGDKKLIMYSMGNFISNQTFEMMNQKWSERGVLMDVTFEKKDGKTIIKDAKALPTLTIAEKNGKLYKNGYPLFDYRVVVTEDFIPGGKYYGKYSGNIQQKIENTYKEINDHVGLKWQ